MAAPTQVPNLNNAFAPPVTAFPFPQGAAVLECANGDSVTLTQGMLVALVPTTTALPSPPFPATTNPTNTGPYYVARSAITGQSDLNIGVVIGEAATTYQQGGASQTGGLPNLQVLGRQAGTLAVLTNGICMVNVGATGGVTAGHLLLADTTTRGAVLDGGASGTGALANIGNYVGVALATVAASGLVLAYISKF